MLDDIRNGLIAGAITIFSQIPENYESGIEKIGFATLVFFLIYFYTKTIFPASQKQLESQNKRIEELIGEVSRLNRLRESDQELIEKLAGKASEQRERERESEAIVNRFSSGQAASKAAEKEENGQ